MPQRNLHVETMYATFSYYILGLLFIDIYTGCSAFNLTTNSHISFFEYGAHVEGEEMSYSHNSFIPAFTPVHSLNVTPHEPYLEKRFTYLRAEYISPMTAVDVIFNPETLILTFYVRFPFFNIPFGVAGYSVKEIHSRVWTSWRKLNINYPPN